MIRKILFDIKCRTIYGFLYVFKRDKLIGRFTSGNIFISYSFFKKQCILNRVLETEEGRIAFCKAIMESERKNED